MSIKLYNDHRLPLIGLGTYSPLSTLQPDPNERWVESVGHAIDIGYRHIDCASFYGNEKQVGEAIAEKILEGVIEREDIFVTSKLWNNKHERDEVVPALQESLVALGLEYLDLYLIHWPFGVPDVHGNLMPQEKDGSLMTTNTDYKTTWRGMEECVERGLTRSIGISNFNREQVTDVHIHSLIKPAVLQMETHPYLIQKELIDYCKSINVAVTAHSPLGKRATSKFSYRLLNDAVMVVLANKYNKTPAQIAIRYQLERGVAVIPKSTNYRRLQENFESLNFKLSKKDMIVLESLNKDIRYVKFERYSGHKSYPF